MGISEDLHGGTRWSILSGMSRLVRTVAQRSALILWVVFAGSAGCSSEPQEQPVQAAAKRQAARAATWFELEVLELIRADWPRVAVERCRERVAASPQAPMPHALMALATWWEPNRAARCCWEAVQRREHGTAHEQRLVDALQEYFSVTEQPELVDERFAAPPPNARAVRLQHRLEELAASADPRERAVTTALRQWARGLSRPTSPAYDPGVEELRGLLRHYNAYLEQTKAMPFEISGYERTVQMLLAKEKDPAARLQPAILLAQDSEPRVARVPRHPELSRDGTARRLPGLTREGGLHWQPPQASGFLLPAGVGGTRAFVPGDGNPTLVVFFLGFGCAHCVAQLKDLDPKAAAFRAAGIEVLSIGTDSYQEVLAAQQASIENGVDPLHFDVLCDPEGEVFRQWQVWDALEDEALHGTFLVDGQGRILWRDISERPFEESEWLLAECRRLLAAWK